MFILNRGRFSGMQFIVEQTPGEGGSEPPALMRGALLGYQRVGLSLGIIPAYVGSTFLWLGFGSGTRDHPRLCGEHTIAAQNSQLVQGSSPLVRGAPRLPGRPAAVRGIIPACAGST